MLSAGTIFGEYRIEEIIGSGAMGVVYKAVDEKQARLVALKLIDEKFAKLPEYRERLTREANTACMIDSPNVVKVWDHAEFQGQPYITLEYVSGKDLREASQECDFEQKIDLACQIAAGLRSAHAKGLIHRDLKPENIKVTDDGQVKILDFGLAKIVSTDSVDRDGNIEGTLYYLSPEQLTGEQLTYSSDIFSYGVVLYEMFTGSRPFEGEYPAAIIYSILHEDPQLPSEINEQLPDWFDEFSARLLAKRFSDRYDNIQSVLDHIERGLREVPRLDVPKFVRARQTVTVVDLKNLSGDESWEYFCTGFTDDLINELSRRTDLIISAEPSSVYTRDIKEVFKRCRSDFAIIGSLIKWQDKIKLHLDIYGSRGKALISGKSYEAAAGDIFGILEQAVKDSSVKLAEVTGLRSIDVEEYFKTDITAYDYYLKGKNYYQTNKPDDLSIAEQMFAKALEIDPNFALAHSGLSDVYAFQYMAYYDRSQEKIDSAEAEALKAIEISPELPEPHRSLGRYYMFIAAYDRAEESFLKAVEISPKYAIGYRTLAWLKELIGDHEKAIYWAQMSLKFAPNDLETLLLLSLINMDLRKYTLALATLQRAIELAPDYGRAYYNLGAVYMKLGVLDLALENFHSAIKYKGDPNAYIDAGYVLVVKNQYNKARQLFKESINEGYFPFISLYLLGFTEKLCGNISIADRYFKEALDAAKECELEDKANPHIKTYLALTWAAMGEKNKAVSILRNLEAAGHEEGDILYNVARAYALLGDCEKVEVNIKKAVSSHAGPSEKEILFDPHFKDYQLPFSK
jgi:non-specific serine/threonine protein kinase